MTSEWMQQQINVLGIRMSKQRFLTIIALACVIYFILYKVSERYWCLLIDHNYGYSIEFPANRVVNTFGKLGNHNHIDEKANFYPRTIFPFLQTSIDIIYWKDEIESNNHTLHSWGREQLRDDWVSTSGLTSVTVGQANYEAWTTTFRRDSWQSRHYYIPHENGTFLIEFSQIGNQNHLNPIRTQMLDSFLIDDAFVTDKADSFERQTIDCIR